jgi:hypothetical protein
LQSDCNAIAQLLRSDRTAIEKHFHIDYTAIVQRFMSVGYMVDLRLQSDCAATAQRLQFAIAMRLQSEFKAIAKLL